jgi:undecaprenyl-diphosphatase
VAREVMRVVHAEHATGTVTFASAVFSSLLGALFAFLSGLIALKWLSRRLEGGRWYLFGIYCLIAALGVGYLHHLGY